MEHFGTTAEGLPVHRVTLRGGGLTARVLTWGAVLQDLRLDGHPHPLVLGFEAFDDYPAHSPWFGAVVGRYANRIAGAQVVLDGRTHRLPENWLGRHTLHGGDGGIGARVWQLAEAGPDHLRLTLVDPDGTDGFPGTLRVSCTYRLGPGPRLSLVLEAETDRATPCSLAPHSYVNLDDGGAGDMLDHRLTLAAGAMLPVDGDLIPQGPPAPVAGSRFDFRSPRPLRQTEGGAQFPYDHCFCLSRGPRPLTPVARLCAARSGLTMVLATTEPGLQLYAGSGLGPPVAGLGGRRYGPFAGVALEPQGWPDAPNRPDFPCAILRPDAPYRHQTDWHFAWTR